MLWRIILALFFSDESLTKYDLAAELSVEPSEVNRVIYRNQANIFLKSGVKIGTSLPLWALTEPVHSELDRILMTPEDVPAKIPDIFCDGALDGGKNATHLCQGVSAQEMAAIRIPCQGGRPMSLPKFLGVMESQFYRLSDTLLERIRRLRGGMVFCCKHLERPSGPLKMLRMQST